MSEENSILTDLEIKERCRKALEELGFANASLIIRKYFDENEKFYPTSDYRRTEPRKISTSKIARTMHDNPEFIHVSKGGNAKTWGVKKE